MAFRWTVAALLALGVAGLLLWGPTDLGLLRWLILGLLFTGAAAMGIHDWFISRKMKRGKDRAKHHPGTYF